MQTHAQITCARKISTCKNCQIVLRYVERGISGKRTDERFGECIAGCVKSDGSLPVQKVVFRKTNKCVLGRSLLWSYP